MTGNFTSRYVVQMSRRRFPVLAARANVRLELDTHQSARERAPRDRLSRASRCARGRDVDCPDRHDHMVPHRSGTVGRGVDGLSAVAPKATLLRFKQRGSGAARGWKGGGMA